MSNTPAASAALPSAGDTREALAAFDQAVAAELPRVSHVEYDSHEICKHFAGEVRKRLATLTEQPAAPRASHLGDLVERCGPPSGAVSGGSGISASDLDITLSNEEAGLLRALIGDDEEPCPIRLLVGDGHSGRGLYVALAEYSGEGVTLLCAAPAAPAQEPQQPEPREFSCEWYVARAEASARELSRLPESLQGNLAIAGARFPAAQKVRLTANEDAALKRALLQSCRVLEEPAASSPAPAVQPTEAVAELVDALGELNALVWGECRSLLDEDSGGNAQLALHISDLLAKHGQPQGGGNG